MPVDTRDKRGSAIGFVLPLPGVWPLADGAALSQADRQQVAWTYRGILVGFIDPKHLPVTAASRSRDAIPGSRARSRILGTRTRGRIPASEN